MARSSLLGLVLAGALSVGCSAPLSVVTQASPDPFAGQARFGVLPVDYSEARIDGVAEAKYLAQKGDQERERLSDGKVALEDGFRRALREAGAKRGISVLAADTQGEAPFSIHASVQVLDPSGGRVEMGVVFLGADGNVLDEIRVSHGGDALRTDGEALGAIVADYLQSRVGKVRAPVAEDAVPERPAAAPRPVAAAPTPELAPPPPTAPPPVEPPPPSPPPPRAVRGRRAPPAVKRPMASPRGKHAPPPPPVAPPGTPVASAPVFSRLPDGTARIWLEVSKKVDVVESRAPAFASYRLRGAVVLTTTNELALPTEFFTTPVTRVQLVQEGPDLVLRVNLREDLAPVYHVADTPRGIVLVVDVPRGSAPLPAQPPPEEPPTPHRHRARSTQTLGHSGPSED